MVVFIFGGSDLFAALAHRVAAGSVSMVTIAFLKASVLPHERHSLFLALIVH